MGNLIDRLGALLLYGGSLTLRPYERQCIDSWVRSLPVVVRQIMTLQLVRLDRYKRQNRGKVLRLFPTGWPNGTPLPSELRVPLREDESRVAKIQTVFGGVPDVACDVIVVMQNGQLASLEFSNLPPLAGGTDAQILSIQHLRDVCSSSLAEGSIAHGAMDLPEGFQWLSGTQIREFKGPRSDEEVRDFLASFKARLPAEYGQLLAKTNGFSVGAVTVYGVGDAWTVPRPDGPFVVLGNVSDVGDVACKAGDRQEWIYLLDAESDQVTQLPHSFSQSLRELILKSDRLSGDGG